MIDIDEIIRYINIGSGYIEVDRYYLPEYKNLCRRTFIRENEIQLDYCTAEEIELGEGETTFYFVYDDFDSMIKSAEYFLEKPLSDWTNYNCTYNEWYFPEDDKNYTADFFRDLQNHKLRFPENFKYFYMRDIYALGVFINKISPDNLNIDRDTMHYLFSIENKFTEY